MKIKTFIILFLSTFFFTSCKKDFLNVDPKGSLFTEKTSDYENLLYNQLSVGRDVPSLILGDEVSAINTYFNAAPLRTQRLFKYDADIYLPEESADELLVPMTSIYIYNKIINEVPNSEGGTLEYKKELVSEAKAQRAYTNMMLMNYYAKPYNSTTAQNDQGIPLVTQADVSANIFQRESVQNVYANIVSDLKESIPNISINQTSRRRMTRSAAELTLAKVYLNKAQYDSALFWIISAKSHYPTGFGLTIYNYNETYGLGNWNIPSNNDNMQHLLVKTSISSLVSTSNILLLAPWAYNLFSPNDKRLNSFSASPYLGSGRFPIVNTVRRIGPFGLNIAQGVYLPDVELMKSECEARLGKIDSAKNTLINFRKLRMPNIEAEIPINLSEPNEVIRFIIDERVREFGCYGMRWFDIRRLYNDPLFKGTFHPHIIYNAQTSVIQETDSLSEIRLVLKFPQSVINLNPNMSNNP